MKTPSRKSSELSKLDLIGGHPGKTLLLFSIPFMLGTLLQTLYSTTDTVIVGQYLGSAGLSAVSNGSLLMQLLYMLCVGFSTAGQVMLAQSEGSKNHSRSGKIIHTLFLSELVIGILSGIICIIFADPILKLLQTPSDAFKEARYYVVICGIGMLFTAFYNMFSAILRGFGDSRHPLIFVAIASVINIILDILFIAVFHWNVAGAALATIIGQLFSVLFSIRFFLKNKATFGLNFQKGNFHADASIARSLIRIGVPLALQTGAVQFSFLFVSRMVNGLGLTLSAAFGAAQKLRNIPGILGQGLGLGCTSMIGQNLGANRQDRVSSTVRWGLLYSMIINVVFAMLFGLAPVLCFRLFTQDESVLAYAPLIMIALVAERPGQALMSPCCAIVNAQGFVAFSSTVGFVDSFGRIFLCWLFGTKFGFGALGFFLGYIGGTYLTGVPAFIYYISGLWKKRQLI